MAARALMAAQVEAQAVMVASMVAALAGVGEAARVE